MLRDPGPLVLSQSILTHEFNEPQLFPTPRLTDFFRKTSMSTLEQYVNSLKVTPSEKEVGPRSDLTPCINQMVLGSQLPYQIVKLL